MTNFSSVHILTFHVLWFNLIHQFALLCVRHIIFSCRSGPRVSRLTDPLHFHIRRLQRVFVDGVVGVIERQVDKSTWHYYSDVQGNQRLHHQKGQHAVAVLVVRLYHVE